MSLCRTWNLAKPSPQLYVTWQTSSKATAQVHMIKACGMIRDPDPWILQRTCQKQYMTV